MTLETEQDIFKKSREAERRVEAKEGKEVEVSEELKRAAVMERADYLVKEVKSGNKQIQNILVHMQGVLQALAQLQQQLSITHTDEPASVAQDKVQIEKIKQKIVAHKDELLKMKDELIQAKQEQLKGEGHEEDVLRKKAEDMVNTVLQAVEMDE